MTPSGSRVIMASALRGAGATSSYLLSMASPYQEMTLAAFGTSTDSVSPIGFPVSTASSKASSSLFSSMSADHLNIIAFLSRGFISRHVPSSKTFLADFTARSISSTSPDATCAITRSSCGAMSSKVFPDAAST